MSPSSRHARRLPDPIDRSRPRNPPTADARVQRGGARDEGAGGQAGGGDGAHDRPLRRRFPVHARRHRCACVLCHALVLGVGPCCRITLTLTPPPACNQSPRRRQVFPLPIEGAETRVLADDTEVVNYMISLGESLEQVCASGVFQGVGGFGVSGSGEEGRRGIIILSIRLAYLVSYTPVLFLPHARTPTDAQGAVHGLVPLPPLLRRGGCRVATFATHACMHARVTDNAPSPHDTMAPPPPISLYLSLSLLYLGYRCTPTASSRARTCRRSSPGSAAPTPRTAPGSPSW